MSNRSLKLPLGLLALLLAWAAHADTARPSPAVTPAPDAQPAVAARVPEPAGMPADADPATVVAEMKGSPVTLKELTEVAATRLAQQRATYQLRRVQLDLEYQRGQQQALEEELNHLLTQRALALEAAARKTTPMALVGTVRVPDVTDEQVRARYESRKTEGAPPFEKVAPQIRKGLQDELTASTMEAFYAALRTKYEASVRLEPLREPAKADGPSRGPANAPITIVEFADFQCPFCRGMEPTLHSLMARYPQQVRLVYRHYPLTEIHPQALPAAQAAVCAERQGKFWEMHDAIFSDSVPLGVDSLRSIAGRIGLDKSTFETCVRGTEVNVPIRADQSAGDALGVRGTPTLFINGRYVQGGVAEEQLIGVIDDELQRLARAAGTTTAAR